jgi:hypothetical protein
VRLGLQDPVDGSRYGVGDRLSRAAHPRGAVTAVRVVHRDRGVLGGAVAATAALLRLQARRRQPNAASDRLGPASGFSPARQVSPSGRETTRPAGTMEHRAGYSRLSGTSCRRWHCRPSPRPRQSAGRAQSVAREARRGLDITRKLNSALAEFPGCDCHGDSVFPELRLVTCGKIVHRAVENGRLMRITSHILWIAVWTVKNPENDAAEGLRGPMPRQ